MSVIKRLSAEGLWSINHLTFEPNQTNVIIGANGAGKSNLLDAIALTGAAARGELQQHLGSAHETLHQSEQTARAARITLKTGQGTYTLELTPDEKGRLIPATETVQIHGEKLQDIAYLQNGGEAGASNRAKMLSATGSMLRNMQNWEVHRPQQGRANPARLPHDAQDNHHLRGDGANLAPYLLRLIREDAHAHGRIVRTVQLAAPYVADLSADPDPRDPGKVQLGWTETGTGKHRDAARLSDATLWLVRITTLLTGLERTQPRVVMVEEPDAGLNPFALTIVHGLLESAAATGAQVFITTQSPWYLDYHRPENVLVLDRQRGETTITAQDPQRLEPWLERYSLGELWDKNELGGRPAGPMGEPREAVTTA